MAEHQSEEVVIRNSPKVLIVEAAGSVWPLIGSAVAFIRGSAADNQLLKVGLIAVGVLIVFFAVVRALGQLFFLRLNASEQGLRYSSGIFVRQHRSFDWSAIATVDKESNPLRNNLDGAKVTVTLLGEQHLSVEFGLVPHADAARLLAMYQRYHGAHSPQEDTGSTSDGPHSVAPAAPLPATGPVPSSLPAQDAATADSTLFAGLTLRDKVMLAVGNGEILLGVPVVFSLLDLVGDLGFSFDSVIDLPLPQLVLRLVVLVVITLVLGLARTWLLYAGWTVTATEQAIKITSGVLTTRTTDFPRGKAVVTTIHRPLALRLWGRVQIRAVTAAPTQTSVRNIVIPLCRAQEVPRYLTLLGAHGAVMSEPPKLHALEVALRVGYATMLLIPLGAAAAGLWSLPWDVPVFVPFLVLLFVIPVLHTATARVHDGGDYQVVTTGLVGRTTYLAGARRTSGHLRR